KSEMRQRKNRFKKTKAVPTGNLRNCKRTKADNSNVTTHAKVKKEKLGKRITTPQQLVSPFVKVHFNSFPSICNDSHTVTKGDRLRTLEKLESVENGSENS
ncbi:hypothetical protein HAX54_043308, partial [Datura stramonium]|nr:hypothetical protein [Datura stramonium]